ncbi:dTMP kinase [Halobellus marinus]|jgi:dTMP kinase|uniref:dTMP kinase n=1 Tax=Halobellus TaxID=1073986 RepID=UPI0028A8C45D|nr:dTMP kinase [Halobellus sp. DFY28]
MLITLEGLDGSGKTTVWESLREGRPDAVFTCEPTESWYGDSVTRSMRDDDADPLAELFLFTADHADHLSRVVRPALANGRVVISDRYTDSRFAYQAAALADSPLADELDPLEYIQSIHAPFTRPPDATIYLDIDPETGAERAGATNKFERASYLEAVRENYERLIEADPERFVRVDAARSPSAVAETVERRVDELIDGERS